MLASDSGSEADSESSGEQSESPVAMHSMKSAPGTAAQRLENALVVWRIESVVRELMDTEAAQPGSESQHSELQEGIHEAHDGASVPQGEPSTEGIDGALTAVGSTELQGDAAELQPAGGPSEQLIHSQEIGT